MATTAVQVSTTRLVDTKRSSDRPKRRQWSEALKRQIVAESMAPGASVSIVARRHDVNANQVFKWRREAMPAPPIAEQSITLLPVEIMAEPDEPRPRARRSGTIEITFACGARVCVRGEVSPETLRQVVELLR
ncbi:MAG: IS66-like element accessory protein TnpA [Burkholderiales bacterium]